MIAEVVLMTQVSGRQEVEEREAAHPVRRLPDGLPHRTGPPPPFSILRDLTYSPPQAGGVATTGKERVLDIVPSEIHQRCPIFLGSKEDVEDLKKFFA